MGRVSGVYGVRGWVRIFSYTEPRENILEYQPWFVKTGSGDWSEQRHIEGRRHGKGVVAHLEHCPDRDAAHALIGSEIAVRREQLPDTGAGEFYWNDLIGLQVVNQQGDALGTVDHLLETGANDVMVVRPCAGSLDERERLIPWLVPSVIADVDLAGRRINVDWDTEF